MISAFFLDSLLSRWLSRPVGLRTTLEIIYYLAVILPIYPHLLPRWDYPQLFSNDPLLFDPANFAFYNTVHIPLIRWLGRILGNYSSPFALLIFPCTLLHLFGIFFTRLRSLFKNRLWSVIFSFTVFIPVQLNLGEIWGAWLPLPRILFQSLLPYLLAAVILWGKNPKSWPWLMAATGLLVYVHPVSWCLGLAVR